MFKRLWERWKSFGRFMGNLFARVMLTLFYFTVLIPFGLVAKLFGDQLGVKSVREKFWHIRETHKETVETLRSQA